MKEGDRVLGIDDASFSSEDEKAYVVGVVYRGNETVEDIRFSTAEVDGEDAAEAIKEIHGSCNNPDHIKAVLIDGLCLAGFNFVDIEKLSEELSKPVIAVTSNRPGRESFKDGLRNAGKDPSIVEGLPEAEEIESERGSIYIQRAGVKLPEAREILDKTSINGLTPEPIRVADLIGARLPAEPV